MERTWESFQSKIKILLLRMEGATIGSKVKLCCRTQFPHLVSMIKIGNGTSLDRNAVLLIGAKKPEASGSIIEIGNNVYINRNTVVDATKKIFIGSETMIGANCYITDHDHAFQNYPANHTLSQLPLSGEDTVIEENVWIGSNVVILKGVRIGAHTVIGAGSVVTRSIPSFSIAVGNPCRVIKKKN